MTLFCFRDWNNKKRHFTAKRLYKRIMKDSKSDYNWIASAAELVQVCERADFPKKYALEIELAILNCFANLELKRHIPSTHANNDEASVDFCYRAIIDANITNDPRINAVKHKYLKAIIAGVVKYELTQGAMLRRSASYGPAYCKICEVWQKERFDEYKDVYLSSAYELRLALAESFNQTIKTAEEKGVFEKEKQERIERFINLTFADVDIDD